MGFGFVEFTTPDASLKALKKFQGKTLDGHSLSLKFSTKVLAKPKSTKRKLAEGDLETGSSGCKKIMVKNLAFEATRQEVRELFGSFGQLKSVRLPKKFDGGHRGFGFVEFLTREEAKSAFAALAATHLYGRKLVVEWADNKDTLVISREKAEKDAAGLHHSKVKKFGVEHKIFDDDPEL